MSEKQKKYDLIIIGSGPAGYTASIYASRYKVDHLIVGAMPGGTITSAHKVCNYPGFKDISGTDLMMKMREQVMDYEAEEVMDRVVGVEKESNGFFCISTQGGKTFFAKSVLLAIGTERRTLGLESEKKFDGKGISYCSTCDGMLYKDKVVGVVGGSNAAHMSAIYLADIAKKVYVIYRKDKLRGDKVWVDEVMNHENIELILNSNVVEFLGNEFLSGVKLDRGDRVLDLDGVFLAIGSKPELDFDLGVDLTEAGYVKVDVEQKTSIEGIYAAGDITDNSNGFEQVITACAEGSVAANSIFYWLKSLD